MSDDGRPQVRWQQAAPPSEAPARRRNWLPLAIAGVLALCLLCAGLVGLASLLRSRSPALATIVARVPGAATAGVGSGLATATSPPAASPAATVPPGGQRVTSGACRAVLPD